MPVFDVGSERDRPKADDAVQSAVPRSIFGISLGQFFIAVCLGLIVVSGIRLYNKVDRSRRIRACTALYSARSVADLEAVVGRYGATPAAPLAILKLAKWHFNAGNYEVALRKYVEFRQRYRSHELSEVAELGRAHCLEASGFTSEAETAFAAFATNHSSHAFAAIAVLGRARCLDAMGMYEQARIVCEDYLASDGHLMGERLRRQFEDFLAILRGRRGQKESNETPGAVLKNPTSSDDSGGWEGR